MAHLSRGQALRDEIAARVDRARPPVVLVGHSLGGIACLDLLVQRALPEVELLLTVGSQAPYLYIIDALPCLRYGQGLPGHFAHRWINVYDRRDLLSFVAGPVFAGRAADGTSTTACRSRGRTRRTSPTTRSTPCWPR